MRSFLPVLRLRVLLAAGVFAAMPLAAASQGSGIFFFDYIPTAATTIDAAVTAIDAPNAGTKAQQGTIVVGIDTAGDVAGTYIDTNGLPHGFVLPIGGSITGFDASCSTGTYQGTVVRAINAGGDTTGYFTCSGATHGFVRSASGTIFSTFDATQSGYGTNSFAINSLGAVTGFTGTSQAGFVRNAGSTATTFSVPIPGGSQYDLYPTMGTAINTAGVIAGAYLSNTDHVSHGFVRAANGTITTFDPANVATSAASNSSSWNSGDVPTAIDTAGDISGSYTDTTGARHGYLRTAAGAITSFDATGAETSSCATSGVGSVACGTIAIGMDDAMNIVGTFFNSDGVACGFLRYGATGAFTTVCASEAGTGAYQGTGFVGVNPSGTVAGTYADSNNVLHGFTYSLPTTQTTTTLTPAPTPNPSVYGESVTLSATVSSSNGTPANGENVTFLSGTTTLGTGQLTSGVASLTTTALPVGTDSITAAYGGDTTFVGSSSTAVSQVVTQASSTTTLKSSLNPSTAGQSVTLTATISGQYGGLPTGSVAFSNGSTSLGSVTLNGSNQAVLTTATLPQGTDQITAVYSGDTNFTGSTSNTLSQVVAAAPAPDFSISLTPSAWTLDAGQSVGIVVTVAPVAGFNSQVSFSCSSGVTCSFSPQTITPGTSLTNWTTMTVTTSAATASLHRDSNPFLPASALAAVLCCMGWKKRRRLLMLVLLAVSMVGLGLMNGCGGASASQIQPTQQTVTVTASSGSLTHTANLALTVYPKP